jgi:hypothetical protein
MIVCILCSERLDRPNHHGLELGVCKVCESLNLPLNQEPPDLGWRLAESVCASGFYICNPWFELS